MAELPLNGRNPFMLAKIVAGVNFNGTVIYQRPFDNGAIAQWTINGGLYESNEFLLDGAPNNAQAGTNNIAYVPPVDAVQEFKIQTNSYDAQYGHTSGGIVNVSLKSGTNPPHGTVYEFARRKAWDANSFPEQRRGRARKASTTWISTAASSPARSTFPRSTTAGTRPSSCSPMRSTAKTRRGPILFPFRRRNSPTATSANWSTAIGQPITIYDPSTGTNPSMGTGSDSLSRATSSPPTASTLSPRIS